MKRPSSTLSLSLGRSNISHVIFNRDGKQGESEMGFDLRKSSKQDQQDDGNGQDRKTWRSPRVYPAPRDSVKIYVRENSLNYRNCTARPPGVDSLASREVGRIKISSGVVSEIQSRLTD